ncbi:M20 family metallopeptidase [Staphylothermus hellenicus]|uniref:Acetylornithine deacetylase or succinyl-diaminopimelate desuccinylase n=1 Tax=Staphylothermus hellenicus (strain DSM 12710 / JCM 10830 / BK20S6-10-b1 / P8) TaxID=591019 RepID=D7DCA4_STAHD|nr:M20 family metallopeptidase [Staphylothermus hellenicus]ADI31801.1 acetylornithine deacetylase or succinyl-diaminopimelate desuccinylase [Staphylothermus hellenicus DSM 12710]
MPKLPEWIYSLAEEILMESIKYPTVLGEAYEEIVNYYANVLKSHGIHVTIHRVPDEYVKEKLGPEMNPDKPRYILLARIGESDKVLQFNGHYDVVFPGEGWKITDPFKPLKKNGRIYGRGSTDMKGGIAAFLAAMIYLATTKEEPPISVEAAIVPDEEIGGATGTGYLVNVLGSKPTWAVIAEPSGLDNIWHGHKGLVWGEIVVKGKQSHGSTPWLGINAFEKMVYVAKYLIENYLPRLKDKTSRYEYDLPEGKHPTATLGGKLSAPGSINIVPGQVSFSIDRRLIIEENTNDAIEELNKYIVEAAKKYSADVELRIIERMEPAFTDPSSEIVEALAKAIRMDTGVEPRRTICVGGLDLRYYSYKGIPVATYGPGEPSMPHKVDEYIEVENLHKVIDVYVDLVNILGRSS